MCTMCTETLEKQCLLASEYKRILLTYRAASSLDSVGNRFPEPPPAKGILVFKPGKESATPNWRRKKPAAPIFQKKKRQSAPILRKKKSAAPILHKIIALFLNCTFKGLQCGRNVSGHWLSLFARKNGRGVQN